MVKYVFLLSLRQRAAHLQVAGWACASLMKCRLDWRRWWGSWSLTRYECVPFFSVRLDNNWELFQRDEKKNKRLHCNSELINSDKANGSQTLPPSQCFRNIETRTNSKSRYIMCLSWIISPNISLHFIHSHTALLRHITSAYWQEHREVGYVACWSFNNKDKTPFCLFHTTGYTFVCKQILNNKEESKPDLEKEQRGEKQGSKTQASLFLHWLRRYQAEFFQPDSQWATSLARQPARQPHRLPLSQFTICLVSLSLSEPTPVCTGEALVATLLACLSPKITHTHTQTHTSTSFLSHSLLHSYLYTHTCTHNRRELSYFCLFLSPQPQNTQNKRLLPVAQLPHPLLRSAAPSE